MLTFYSQTMLCKLEKTIEINYTTFPVSILHLQTFFDLDSGNIYKCSFYQFGQKHVCESDDRC